MGAPSASVSFPGTASYPNDRVGAYTPGFANACNYGGNSEGSYSVDAAHGGPSSGPIIGSVTTDMSGTLLSYFHLYWSGTGPPSASADFLVSTQLYAQASANYGSGPATSGLSVTATVTVDAFKETASASAGDGASLSGVQSVNGFHVVPVQVDPSTGIAKVYVSGKTHWVISDTAPYATAGATTAVGDSLVRAGATLTSASLGAHSTVDTSAPGNPWDPMHPRFFSGTNCSAIANAVAMSGYVLHAQLLVGGTDVKDYYDTSFVGPLPQGAATGTNQTSASLTVYFDSTHFPDASSIPIQMTVSDTTGKTYDSSLQASAYNEGYVGYEPTTNTFGQYGQPTASNVDRIFAQSNIKNNDSTTSDTRDAVLAAVTVNTDFFTYSYGQHHPDSSNHLFFESPSGIGNSNGVLYGSQSLDPSSTTQNLRNDIAEAVAAKGVNPPPYNFVYLDICDGGYDSEFAGGFGLSASGTADRAFFGWNGWVDDSGFNQNWTTYLYAYLQSGETLSKAIADADMSPNGRPVDNNMSDASYHSKCPYLISGDGSMTLHGTVYQGATGSWYR